MNLIEPTQYRIEEMLIFHKGGGQPISIENMFEELNLFDSLFLPVISGNVLIVDTKQMIKNLVFDGTEVLAISMSKGIGSGFASFKKSYRIYSLSDRRNKNQTTETYVLHFVSDEFVLSDQKKVNQSYETTYSDAIDKIMTHYLQVSRNSRGAFQQSYGIRKIVIPNLPALDAIEWCTKRALSVNNSPEYLFFCNNEGYNFLPLSTLLTKDSILNISFTPKNLGEGDEFFELSRARSFEVLSQYDLMDKIQGGVNANKLLAFDPITKSFGSQEISLEQIYKLIEHGNKNPIDAVVHNRDNQTSTHTSYDSKQALSIYNQIRGKSNYVKESDPTSISKNEPYELFMTQRKAIMNNLMTRRLKITMPGNFQLTSGKNINFDTSGFGTHSKGKEGEQDESISGKYIITGARHILSSTRHITVMEVASDSTNQKTHVNTPEQTKVATDYSKIFATYTG
jgi:hypothetical protein